jgi:hypothetical protein
LIERFGPGRDFRAEVRAAIASAGQEHTPRPARGLQASHRDVFVFATDIRFFRGDFDS